MQELIKMEKKSQKQNPKDYNLLIAQDLWQDYYQILLVILLKEFIKSKVNMSTMTKTVKRADLNTSIATAFSNIQTLNMI